MIDPVFGIQAGLAGATSAHLFLRAGLISNSTSKFIRNPIVAGAGLGIASTLTNNFNDNVLHATVAGAAALGAILANRFMRRFAPSEQKLG